MEDVVDVWRHAILSRMPETTTMTSAKTTAFGPRIDPNNKRVPCSHHEDKIHLQYLLAYCAKRHIYPGDRSTLNEDFSQAQCPSCLSSMVSKKPIIQKAHSGIIRGDMQPMKKALEGDANTAR